jgi:hypothetical protein
MRTYQKWLMLFTIIGLFLLGSCADQNIMPQDTTPQADYIDENELEVLRKEVSNIDNDRDLQLYLGEKIQSLSDIPGIDGPAVTVNGYPITKKTVESIKILNVAPNSIPLKDEINSTLRHAAINAEANKKGIKPSQDSIDTYLKQGKDSLENRYAGTDGILAYIEGREITIDAYLSELEEVAYEMYQREALWLSVRNEKKIEAEAIKRNVETDVVDKEQYDKYIEGLMKKAKIEILVSNYAALFA